MKKAIKNTLIISLLLVGINLSFGQTILHEEFNDSSGFTSTPDSFFSDGSDDYYGIYDTGTTNDDFGVGSHPSGVTTSGFVGTYLVGEDMNGDGNNATQTTTWTGMDITGYTNLKFEGKFASSGLKKYDATDKIKVEISIDGGSFVSILAFEADGDESNEDLAVDSDFDGIGDGTKLTSNAQTFNANISGTGLLLDLKVTYTVEAGSEEFGVDDFKIINSLVSSPEIDITGNGNSILDGDVTPSAADDTDFGSIDTAAGTMSHTFTILNNGTANLDLTDPSPYVVISGANAADFTLSVTPSTPIVPTNSTTFEITFDPSADGLREATISIANNDADEDPYNFSIQGTGTTPAAPCSQLFISEYGEPSSGNGKYIEIYNPTANAIDLSDYKLQKHTNGGSGGTSNLILAGTLNAYETWVIGNNSTDVPTADQTSSSVCSFNGDDVVELLVDISGTFTSIDIIGVNSGTDPGAGWDVAGVTNATKDHTMIRKDTVNKPNTDWVLSAGTNADDSEWVVINYTQDNLSTNYSLCKCTDTATYDAGAWVGGITPDLTKQVIINDNYNTDLGEIDACSCTINLGVTLTVSASTDLVSKHLNVVNDIVNNGTIIVKNEGSLVQENNHASITGTNFQIQKSTTEYIEYDFTYWSSPIENANLATVFTDSEQNRIYTFTTVNFEDIDDENSTGNSDSFDDNNDDWVVASGIMETGKGYIVEGKGATWPFDGDNIDTGLTQDVVFVGKINNGSINIKVYSDANLTASDSGVNQNLLGNPYPSAIDIKKLQSANNSLLTGTYYFWTHGSQIGTIDGNIGPDAFNFSNDDYATATTDGIIFNSVASTGTISKSAPEFIASGQGFFANIIDDTNVSAFQGDVVFDNSMRVNGNNTEFRNNTVYDRVWLNMTNDSGVFRQILVGFFESATNEHDNGIDGERLINGDNFDFYSLLNNERYAIQGLPLLLDEKVIPLGIEAPDTGILVISIDHFEGDLENVNIYLKDNLLNNIHDLKIEDYTLDINQIGEFNERFELVFSRNPLSISNNITPNSDLIVSNLNNDIYFEILDGNKISKIQVFDVIGKLVLQSNPNNYKVNIKTNINNGTVLFIKIQLENGQILTKKFIKY